jgi:hypothetical protein
MILEEVSNDDQEWYPTQGGGINCSFGRPYVNMMSEGGLTLLVDTKDLYNALGGGLHASREPFCLS